MKHPCGAFMWGVHAVRHSAKSMDWIAGARMHFLEIIALRSLTAIPMFSMGYSMQAILACLLIVYVYSTFIHANLGCNMNAVAPLLVTPRFHHWRHGIDKFELRDAERAGINRGNALKLFPRFK